MSGYTDHFLGSDAELGEVEFLNKPFTAVALATAVGRAMATKRDITGELRAVVATE